MATLCPIRALSCNAFKFSIFQPERPVITQGRLKIPIQRDFSPKRKADEHQNRRAFVWPLPTRYAVKRNINPVKTTRRIFNGTILYVLVIKKRRFSR